MVWDYDAQSRLGWTFLNKSIRQLNLKFQSSNLTLSELNSGDPNYGVIFEKMKIGGETDAGSFLTETSSSHDFQEQRLL